MPEFEQKLAALVESHEGRLRSMYPDSAGNVTVGVGHLLANVAVASDLPFYHVAPGQPHDRTRATRQQICAGWAFVKNNHKLYPALELSDEDIDKLRDADLASASTVVRHFFPAAIPDPVAVALGDMAFNLGSFHKFPKLVAAVERSDWQQAASECERRGISHRRNEDTRQLFLIAMEGSPESEPGALAT